MIILDIVFCDFGVFLLYEILNLVDIVFKSWLQNKVNS